MRLAPEARVALYYAPEADDPLFAAGAGWLGRDPATNAALPQPDLPDIAAVTADARLYGFHATLKPPMRVRDGRAWEELAACTAQIAAGIAPFDLPPLAVADLSGFLALRETVPSAPLRALADAAVTGLDEFRTLPDARELARRHDPRLSPERKAMLLRWGYPDVFDTWVFHMTLTRRLTPAERSCYQPAGEAHFAPALRYRRPVCDICLFVQPAPGAPFAIAARLALGCGRASVTQRRGQICG